MESPQSSEQRRAALTDVDVRGIREQLERMLANPLFTHSKRYPTLLRYIVERTLDAPHCELKERTIGVEVFGREPNYDTNADPIVRAAAGEVRKRIAQYYHEVASDGEIRIGLTPGSYVPEFVLPHGSPPAPDGDSAGHTTELQPEGMFPSGSRWDNRLRWFARFSGWAAVTAALVLLAWFKPWTVRPSSLDRFWGPVLDSSSTVRICVGQRAFSPVYAESKEDVQFFVRRAPELPRGVQPPVNLLQLYYMGSQNVALPDVLTVTRVAGLLQSKGKSLRVLGESFATFEDLREGPAVLVGAFTNDWTLRLTESMRFRFSRQKDIFRLRDTRNPSRPDWVIDYTTPFTKVTEDYGLISRVLDPTTERMAVIVGGLTGYSTIAAGELLTDASYMDALIKHAPQNWERKNLQIVVATRVIDGKSGPPRIVDQYFW